VSLLLNSLPNKQSELDPIPTSLLKDCASVVVPVITKVINLTLSSSNFPMVFKHSLVTPLLYRFDITVDSVNFLNDLVNTERCYREEFLQDHLNLLLPLLTNCEFKSITTRALLKS